MQCLVIPVKKLHGEKTPISDVEIDYSGNWQKIHLKSIQSAYQTSPFYEYYADDFNALLNEMPGRLFDLNILLLRLRSETGRHKSRDSIYPKILKKHPLTVLISGRAFNPNPD